MEGKSLKISAQMESLKASLLAQLGSLSSNQTVAKAIQSAGEQHFPVAKNEEWKYSPFSVPRDAAFQLRTLAGSASGQYSSLPEGDFVALHIVDGVYQSVVNKVLPAGISIQPITELEQMIDGYEQNIFNALNAATAHVGGFRLEVAPHAEVNQTILFAFHFSDTEAAAWIQPRIQISVGENAKASFAERWVFPAGHTAVANAITEVQVSAGAHVTWSSLEQCVSGASLINQTRVTVEEKAVFQHVVVAIGEGYVRNNLEIKINGTEGDAHMYGLSLGSNRLHVDHHTFVNHKAENTTSNQMYKGIMGGKSTGVFNGKILVDQAAQKTNAYQSSKNILLSNDAKVYAKPQLEIFADDVKCSHGATIGALDEVPIFYLRSRGLDENTAKLLLIQAFASEVLMKIDDQKWHDYVQGEVMATMQAMF